MFKEFSLNNYVVNVMDSAMLDALFKDAIIQPLFKSINDLTIEQVSCLYIILASDLCPVTLLNLCYN